MSVAGTFARKAASEEDAQTQWMSLSDLMAALMMVFLLISVSMMRQATIDDARIMNQAESWVDTHAEIHRALQREFEQDLSTWGATLDKGRLEIAFLSPDVLFETSKTSLKEEYQNILAAFFPRYMEVLTPYRNSIEEVRIEGHTSSEWRSGSSLDDAYFENMRLSQGRTRSVLQYVYGLPASDEHKDWIRESIAAVGLSSSKAIRRGGIEDQEASRRVTFRVMTDAEEQIQRMVVDP